MRKRCTPILFCFLLLIFFGDLEAQTYQVQLAAFTEEIDRSFFDFAGYGTIYEEKDHNNFTRYTLGEFFSMEVANSVRQQAIGNGFYNAHIIALEKPQFAYIGDSPLLPLKMVRKAEQLFIRSVLFSADDLKLNKALLSSLEEALIVMKEQSDLKLRIVGHTDDIGEPSTNQAISKCRARIIRNFLLANGIPAYRLKMRVSDEPSPEVYFEDKGLPRTRDFNRRIILTLVDLKEEIVVDDFHGMETQDNPLSTVDGFISVLKSIKFV